MKELSGLIELLGCIEFVAEVNDNQLVRCYGTYDISLIDYQKLSKFLKPYPVNSVWIDFNEIAVNPDEFKVQLDLLGIVNEPVLLIKSPLGDAEILWFIKFVNYEINKELYYGPDQKLLLEKLIYLWLSNNVKPAPKPEIDVTSFLELSVNQSFVICQLKKSIAQTKQEAHDAYNLMLKQVLLSSQKDFPQIIFSEDAINFIVRNKISGNKLNELLIKSASTLYSMFPSSSSLILDDYLLGINLRSEELNISDKSTEENILFKPKSVQTEQKQSLGIEKTGIKRNSTDNTIRLLDRYELAVQKLLDNNEQILGKTIAAACDPPISAPGLTDSINKHKERIGNLLTEFPEKWPLLRSHYAPIAKILTTDFG
jgi:hypothetical protein